MSAPPSVHPLVSAVVAALFLPLESCLLPRSGRTPTLSGGGGPTTNLWLGRQAATRRRPPVRCSVWL